VPNHITKTEKNIDRIAFIIMLFCVKALYMENSNNTKILYRYLIKDSILICEAINIDRKNSNPNTRTINKAVFFIWLELFWG
jgi:hypothetical protein